MSGYERNEGACGPTDTTIRSWNVSRNVSRNMSRNMSRTTHLYRNKGADVRKSERLRVWQRSGWSYRGLAAQSGFAVSVIHRAVRGDTVPRREVADAIARAVSTAEKAYSAEELFAPKVPRTIERAA